MINFYLLILNLMICNVYSLPGDINQNETIRMLEKEKSNLLKQIHEAIDDSLNYLNKTNNSDTILGINYMKELKEYMQEINSTDLDLETEIRDDEILDSEVPIDYKKDNNSQNLRRYREEFYKLHNGKKRNKKISVFKWENMMNNTLNMQKRIDEWVEERKREKERLKWYKKQKKLMILQGKFESCPRFGYKKKKGKKGKKEDMVIRECDEWIYEANQDKYKECMRNAKKEWKEKNKKNRRKVKSLKFPCCRKCCKKSHMGCL